MNCLTPFNNKQPTSRPYDSEEKTADMENIKKMSTHIIKSIGVDNPIK